MCSACDAVSKLNSASAHGSPMAVAPPGQRRKGSAGQARFPGEHCQGDADLLITGGPILTMDANRPRAESVAVRAGRIMGVGSADELEGLTGRDTEVVDLDGRTLLPGLIDPHMHSSLVQLNDWVDLSPMARPTADCRLPTMY